MTRGKITAPVTLMTVNALKSFYAGLLLHIVRAHVCACVCVWLTEFLIIFLWQMEVGASLARCVILRSVAWNLKNPRHWVVCVTFRAADTSARR